MKRNNNIIYLVFLIILIVITIFVVLTRSKSTIPEKHRNFAVKDTSSITKIFLADMEGKSVTLIRSSNTWLVNDTYPCNMERIGLLLDVISNLKVKSTVPLSLMNTVITDLATKGIKIEIYRKKKKIKAYYVGSETNDALGTYMALDIKHKEPFIMYIPGFEGFLTPRYFTNVSDWRSKIVFNYNPLDIKTVTIKYSDTVENSFKLEVNGPNSFSLTTLENKIPFSGQIDTRKIKSFLVGFHNVQIMDIVDDMPKSITDSLLNSYPVITVSVTDVSGKSTTLKLFYRQSRYKTRTELKPGIDKDYFYGESDLRKGELALIQAFTYNRILWKISDFKKEN